MLRMKATQFLIKLELAHLTFKIIKNVKCCLPQFNPVTRLPGTDFFFFFLKHRQTFYSIS